MPIAPHSPLAAIPRALALGVSSYNALPVALRYNGAYNAYVASRGAGTASAGSLSGWIAGGAAHSAMWSLLDAFDMNRRGSRLVHPPTLRATLTALSPTVINWIASIHLPLAVAPALQVNPGGTSTLAVDLTTIHGLLARRGAVSHSGGYAVASKTMHCLFPELAPMIDGRHTGVSYFNILRRTYLPPPPVASWVHWIGAPMIGPANPSPRGGGRRLWGAAQFLAVIGINQHIYDLWQRSNGSPGLPAFLALDPTPGTTGIPRIIDKGLW